MSNEDQWHWEYAPGTGQVAGYPGHVVTEVERLASELVALAEFGVDITDIGQGPRPGAPGGLRRIPLLTDGWLVFLPAPRCRLIAITGVVPPLTQRQKARGSLCRSPAGMPQ